MADANKNKNSKTVPVRVSIDRRPAPTKLPPVATADLRPVKKIEPPKKTAALKSKLSNLNSPVHAWPEAKRRRLMWWLVAGGTLVIVIGWAAVLRYEISPNHQGKNIIRDITNLFKSVDWTTDKKTSAIDQKIQELNKQVFPQFQK